MFGADKREVFFITPAAPTPIKKVPFFGFNFSAMFWITRFNFLPALGVETFIFLTTFLPF